MHNMQLQ